MRSPLYLNCSKTKGVRFERSATISQGGYYSCQYNSLQETGIDRENMKTKNVDDTVRIGESDNGQVRRPTAANMESLSSSEADSTSARK